MSYTRIEQSFPIACKDLLPATQRIVNLFVKWDDIPNRYHEIYAKCQDP